MATTMAPGTIGQDNLWTDLGEDFLFAEDEALKTWLKGMTVSDEKNPTRPVGVWFALPDLEVRDQAFPFLVVELMAIVEAKDREMRGALQVINDPGAVTAYSSGTVRWAATPLPVNLVYQVTAYARHPRHNRQIIRQMLSQRLPGRLVGLPVPGDNSKRSMELVSWQAIDSVENGRKLWQTVYTVQIASEISDLTTTVSSPPVDAAPVLGINTILMTAM